MNTFFRLQSKFAPAGDQPKAIRALVSGLRKGYRYQTLLGVTGSGKTFSAARIIAATQKPTLVIAPNKTLAAQLYQEYKYFFPHNKVCYFVSYYDYYQPEAYLPVTDTYIEKEAMINEEIDRFRHLATSALMTRRDVIVVASVSCIYNLGVPENYFGGALKLGLGQLISRADLIRQFSRMGYERNNTVLKRGTFRARGETIELAPPAEEIMYRIVLQDQQIARIDIANLLTRKTIESISDLLIFPPKHFVTTAPERERAVRDIKTELKDQLAYFDKKGFLLEAERLERRTKYDLEMIGTIGYCHGIENYSRHLSGKLPGEPPETLLSYFPRDENGKPDFLTIIDESHITVPQVRGMYEGDISRKKVLVEHGWRLASALDNRPLNFKEFEERIGQVICTSATPGPFEHKRSSQVVEQVVRPTGLVDPPIEIRPVFVKKTKINLRPELRSGGNQKPKSEWSQIDDIMEEAAKNSSQGGRTIINTLTKKTAEELTEFLLGKSFRARYMHSDTPTLERTKILQDFRKNEFDVLVGINLLREGLDLPEVTLVAILDADREGFLRSETSLIQTMGRAARNVRGKVILYADTMTGSMKRAIKECSRRRKIQLAYNKKHNITPKTVEKEVREFS